MRLTNEELDLIKICLAENIINENKNNNENRKIINLSKEIIKKMEKMVKK